MREIRITFSLTEEQEKRLKKITEGYKDIGFPMTEEKIFEMIMCTGCRYDIDNKLKFHECKLGIESTESGENGKN